MNILHITSTLNPAMGGVAEAVKSFITISEQQGVYNELVTLDDPGEDYLQSKLTPQHSLGPNHGFLRHSKNIVPWLMENIMRFDAVIINGLWGYHTYATWKTIHTLKNFKKETKLPAIFVMPHGMLDPYFQKAKERRFKAIRNVIYWTVIEGNVINDADALLFTSETELILARQTFKAYNPKNEFNVGYGINPPPVFTDSMPDAFNASCPGLNGKPYILFLGRIDTKKGVDLLVQAYIELKLAANAKQHDFPELVIAGPGIDTDFGKKILAEIAKQPALTNNIHFPGMLNKESKWGAFYGCEAFILPSHQENFGIAVVEAMACGKPVLISNQVNIWREINEGGAGIIEDDNLTGTKSLLQRWVKLSADEKSNMGERAVQAFKKYFKLDKAVNNMLAVISNTISNNAN